MADEKTGFWGRKKAEELAAQPPAVQGLVTNPITAPVQPAPQSSQPPVIMNAGMQQFPPGPARPAQTVTGYDERAQQPRPVAAAVKAPVFERPSDVPEGIDPNMVADRKSIAAIVNQYLERDMTNGEIVKAMNDEGYVYRQTRKGVTKIVPISTGLIAKITTMQYATPDSDVEEGDPESDDPENDGPDEDPGDTPDNDDEDDDAGEDENVPPLRKRPDVAGRGRAPKSAFRREQTPAYQAPAQPSRPPLDALDQAIADAAAGVKKGPAEKIRQLKAQLDDCRARYKETGDQMEFTMAMAYVEGIKLELGKLTGTAENPSISREEKLLDKVMDAATGKMFGKGEDADEAFEKKLKMLTNFAEATGMKRDTGGNQWPDDPDIAGPYFMGQVIRDVVPQAMNQITDTIRDVSGHGSLKDRKGGQQQNPPPERGRLPPFTCQNCKKPIAPGTLVCQTCGNQFTQAEWDKVYRYYGVTPPGRQQPAQQPAASAQAEATEPEFEPGAYDPKLHGTLCRVCNSKLDETGFCAVCDACETCGTPLDDDGYCPKCEPADEEPTVEGPAQATDPDIEEVIPEKPAAPKALIKRPVVRIPVQQRGPMDPPPLKPLPELPREALGMFDELHRVAMWITDREGVDPVAKVDSLYQMMNMDGVQKHMDTVKGLLYAQRYGVRSMVKMIEPYKDYPGIREGPETIDVITSISGIKWMESALNRLYERCRADGITLSQEDIKKIEADLKQYRV